MTDSTRPARFRALLPYLAVSALQLALLVTGPGWATTASKSLCMPLLALAVVLMLREAPGFRVVLGAAGLLLGALGLSWAGDVLLTFPGWFVPGLCAFLLAHVAYIALFVRMPRAGRLLTPWTGLYALWYVVFLALMLPHLGALAAPVALYGLVLGTMAAFAAAHGRLIAWGGALFVVSDTVLALGRFLPGYEFAGHDLTVMSTYLAAQGLIAAGAVLALRAAAPSSPAPDRRVVATAP